MNGPIAIVVDYPLSARGGVSVIVESLLRFLSPDIGVLLVSPDEPESLKASPLASRLRRHIRLSDQYLTRADARELAATLIESKVRIAHFHGGGTYAWGCRTGFRSPFPFLAKAKIRTIFSAHQVNPLRLAYYPAERRYWYKLAFLPVILWAGTYALSQTAQVVTDSRHDAQMLRRQYPLLRRKIGFIYHSRLDGAERPQEAANSRQQTILSVGHVARRKGQHILAEAFGKIASRFPDWKLIIAGEVIEPSCLNRIEQVRAEYKLGDRIQAIGSHPAPRSLMESAGIFVQPSLMEALGLALQEAMFLGCACVGSSTGGIPELITDHQTGRLFRPGDSGSLAEALASLMDDPEKRKTFGKAARADIIRKGMTGQAMAANYENLYNKLLED
jgi:glycosyltransferase involved in cell wall biosynthesis